MTLHVEVIGEDVAAAHLKEIGARAADARPAMEILRELLIEGNRKQFASAGSHLGGAWPPLEQATVDRKGSSEILVASGALRASLTGGRGRKTSVTRSSVSVGTSVWYAHFAEGGTEHEPARDLVGISAADLVRAKEILQHYLTEGLL